MMTELEMMNRIRAGFMIGPHFTPASDLIAAVDDRIIEIHDAKAAEENPDPPISGLCPKPPSAPPRLKARRRWPQDAQCARLSFLVDGLQVRVHDLELVGRGRQDELSAEIEKVREWCARHKHYFEVLPGVEVHQTRGPMDAGQL